MTTKLTDEEVLIVGGSRGLGLGVAEAFAARGTKVTIVARNQADLLTARLRLGISTRTGDATDPAFAIATLQEIRPKILVLNAGATPTMVPLHAQTWETFSATWNTDVKMTFDWIQAVLRLPLGQGSKVLLTSSGAAVNGSPLSGGYAGAKHMIRFMADYANGIANNLALGLCFQAVLPLQIVAATELGRTAAEAYARSLEVSTGTFLARFGKPLDPRTYGDHIVSILTDPKYQGVTAAIGIRGESGIQILGP